MKRILFLLLLWLGLPAAAQVTTASISGRIVDENGPIEGVTVVAIHQPTNTQYYATTGRGGWYQLLDVLPGGPYTLRVHYFSYKPLTVRNLFTYAGQNVVVDADLEAGTSEIRIDEAATSLRLGASLGGGAVPVSPLGFDLVSQEIDTPVPFDVRQEAPLEHEPFPRFRLCLLWCNALPLRYVARLDVRCGDMYDRGRRPDIVCAFGERRLPAVRRYPV